MTFKSAVVNEYNERLTKTTNGMTARKTTASAVLDYFGKAGASRGKDISKDFITALVEHEELAMRALLWTRDIRGGAGERKQFRDLLQVVERRDPELAGRIMHKIPELGRWDDLFAYKDSTNIERAFYMIGAALKEGNGLAAKWMPRKGPIAKALTAYLGLSPRQYRKLLVGLTNVVETQMCAKQWDKINFSHVPSQAARNYQKAFGRNAPERYSAYIHELKKPVSERHPNVKINAGAVYPHDVVKSVFRGNAAVADEQWKALPNYVGNAKILPMVDVSGSMTMAYGGKSSERPIDVAVGLGLYLSEKNTSAFQDLFLTFSGKPQFVHVRGSLSDRIHQMSRADWAMNTNIEAAFDSILNLAKRSRVAPEDMPEMLLILSDMQFDASQRVHYYSRSSSAWNPSAVELVREKYARAGYVMPKLVFWNLNAHDNTPVRYDENGTALVSGFSPAIMKSVLSVNGLENFTPLNVMLETLANDRYSY